MRNHCTAAFIKRAMSLVALLVSGCALHSHSDMGLTESDLTSPAYGVDYYSGPTILIERHLVPGLGKSSIAFVGRYVVGEKPLARKLINPNDEAAFIGSTPLVLIAIPRPGSNHPEEVGREDGTRTADEVFHFFEGERPQLLRPQEAVAVFLDVEGIGKLSNETELGKDYYRGWASALIDHSSALGIPMRPALYMPLAKYRAGRNWINVAEVESSDSTLAPVAIWAHAFHQGGGSCALTPKWYEGHQSILPTAPRLQDRVFAIQYAMDCGSDCDKSRECYDISVVRSSEALRAVAAYLPTLGGGLNRELPSRQ